MIASEYGCLSGCIRVSFLSNPTGSRLLLQCITFCIIEAHQLLSSIFCAVHKYFFIYDLSNSYMILSGSCGECAESCCNALLHCSTKIFRMATQISVASFCEVPVLQVLELGLTLFDEGGHAFLLINQAERGMEGTPLEEQTFLQR